MHISPSLNDLSATWRLLVLRAVIVLALAVTGLPWPQLSVAALVVLVAAIAVVAALFDAALAGALHTRATGGWVLLPEAALGFLLGGAILLYPLVPLSLCTVLLSAWVLVRGLTLAAVVRPAVGDVLVRTLAMGWIGVSILAPLALGVLWRETTILSLAFVVIAYALVWSLVEFGTGIHLRSLARS